MEELKGEGNELFGAERHAEAASKYSEALDTLQMVAAELRDAEAACLDTRGEGAEAREQRIASLRVACLANRAACLLQQQLWRAALTDAQVSPLRSRFCPRLFAPASTPETSCDSGCTCRRALRFKCLRVRAGIELDCAAAASELRCVLAGAGCGAEGRRAGVERIRRRQQLRRKIVYRRERALVGIAVSTTPLKRLCHGAGFSCHHDFRRKLWVHGPSG